MEAEGQRPRGAWGLCSASPDPPPDTDGDLRKDRPLRGQGTADGQAGQKKEDSVRL